MQLELVLSKWISYLQDTIMENFVMKFFVSIGTIFVSEIYLENPLLVKLVIFVYLADFALWLIKAIRFRIYSSRALFKWATKLIVYWIMLMTALAIDISLGWNLFLPFIITFIILTDASSIFENLEELWYQTPPFIWRVLQIHKNKMIAEKFKAIYWDDILIDIHEDFKQMKNVYIPNIKNPINRWMFEMKIWILEDFIVRIAELKIDDVRTFKIQFDLLLSVTWEKLEDVLKKTHYKTKDVEIFLWRHKSRAALYIKEVEKIFDEAKDDEKASKQLKNNIIQASIRVVYKWISDNINL